MNDPQSGRLKTKKIKNKKKIVGSATGVSNSI
jgi:hypothetical protein